MGLDYVSTIQYYIYRLYSCYLLYGAQEMIYWQDDAFYSEASPMGFNFSNNYGPCAWEGTRCYDLGDGKYHVLFLQEHMERLLKSAKALNIEVPFSVENLCDATLKLVSEYDDKNIYLRHCIFINRNAEGVSRKPNESYSVAIYPTPVTSLPKPKDGIKVGISTYRRGYPQFQMQIKNASNYLVGQMVKSDMERQGFDDAILQDNNGYLTEAIVSNLFIIKDNILYTPPSDGSILEGLTRKWVIQNFKAVQKSITRYDLYTADAAFVTGTFVEMNWIRQCDHVQYEKHESFASLHTQYKKFIQGGNFEQPHSY